MGAIRRVLLVAVTAGLIASLAPPAQGAQQYHVSTEIAPDNDGGVFLFNRPGYYYMGRLYQDEHFDRTSTAVYKSGNYRSSAGYIYRWGRAHGSAASCLWIGPSASGPGTEYLTNDSTAVADQCSQSGSKSTVGSTEWLKNRSNIGTSFNCPDHKARGPQNTTMSATGDIYNTVHWDSTYSGGNRGGTSHSLPAGTPVQYRYKTKDGSLAALFAPGFGWGFVLASKVTPVSGRWSFAGATSQSWACGQNLTGPAASTAVSDEGPVPTLAGRPRVITWGPGHLDVFARGTDDELWHRALLNGQWSTWQSLGGALNGNPQPISWGNGRIDVFARGQDDDVQHVYFNGSSWSDWESLGGVITSDPVPGSWGSGHLDVFVRDTGGGLQHRWFGTSGWSGWDALGGSFSGNPIPISWGYAHMDVFTRTTGSALQHIWFNGSTWQPWEALGGSLTSDPVPISWGSGHLDVFARDAGGGQSHRWYGSSAWQAWGSLGGSSVGRPEVVSWGYGHIDVFVVNSLGQPWHRYYTNSNWSPGWESLGSANLVGGDLDATSWSQGRIDLFGRGASNQDLQYTWFDGTWHPWSSFGIPADG